MDTSIFDKIDFKIVEIMNLIEHEKDFPIFFKDVNTYIGHNQEKLRLCEIYIELSKLRSL